MMAGRGKDLSSAAISGTLCPFAERFLCWIFEPGDDSIFGALDKAHLPKLKGNSSAWNALQWTEKGSMMHWREEDTTRHHWFFMS